MTSTPPKSKRALLIAALLTLAAAAALAPACRQTPAPAEPEAVKVRIGYLPIIGDLPLFVAAEQGYFKKYRLDVELVRFESSPTMGTAFVNNQVDAVASLASTVAFSIESRDPGKFKVFIADAYTPQSPLSAMVALRGSGIDKVEDLRGKKVGTFPGPSTLLFFSLIMKKHGLDPAKDVTVIELPPGNQIQALVGKQVDALNTLEPIATQAVLDHQAVNYNPGAIEREIINPYHGGLWLISADLVGGRPDVAARVTAACYEALDSLRANPAEAKKSLAKYVNVSQGVAEGTPTPTFSKADEVDVPVLRRYVELIREGGVIGKSVDPAGLLIDVRLLERARPADAGAR